MAEEEIIRAFESFDLGQKGFVDMADLKSAAKELGEDWEDELIKGLIDMADRDHDGKVDLQDFLAFFNQDSSSVGLEGSTQDIEGNMCTKNLALGSNQSKDDGVKQLAISGLKVETDHEK